MKYFAPAIIVAWMCLVRHQVMAQNAPGVFIPVTDKMLQSPDPGDGVMWRRTLDSWGYSTLKQITRQNVANLRMVWTRGMGLGLEKATPLVYKGMMYLPKASDLMQAINGATGDLIWEYHRELRDNITKTFPVPSINRKNGKRYIAIGVGAGGAQEMSLPPLVPEIKYPDRAPGIWVFDLP